MDTPIEYLEWINGRPEQASHDLGSSDMLKGRDDWPVPDRLADRPDPDRPLDAQIADEYGVEPSNVLVTPGASAANAFAGIAALAEGGRALVERPGYEPLWATPKSLGTPIDRFDRPAPEFPLDPDRVAESATGETALVTVTNRHNPTGRRVSRDDLAAVSDVAADRDATVLVDEVYAPYGPEPATGRTAFGGPTAAGLPNTVVTGSLTKFHGLGGIRIGWIVGPESFVGRARTAAYHVPTLSKSSVALARRAVAASDELDDASRAAVAENAGLLAAFAEERDDLAGPVFDGCCYGALAHDRADGTAVSEAAWAAGVLVVPGRFFNAPDRFRVSLGRDPDHCAAALSALGDVLDEL